MRPVLVSLTALSLLALPAAAQAQSDEREMTRAVELLNDPAMQDGLADAMTAMMGALMSMKIGPVAEAAAKIDPESRMADMDPDATLGEVAGYNSDEDGARMGDEVRDTTRMMGTMAGSPATMLPVLKDMARDMEAQWKDAARRN